MRRADFLAAGLGAAGAASLGTTGAAQSLTTLDVAYAGSMGSLMEGPVKAAVAKTLGIAMRGRALGADALAKLIVAGAIPVDVFISVTAAPVEAVIQAGKAAHGVPIARTEMVIAYSPRSRFAASFKTKPWYEVLLTPGARFGRTDPATDPQGRNIIFTMQLAQAYYRVPGLARRILGSDTNPAQIFSEPTVEARLQSGELDAASAYRIQPGPFHLPYVTLPDQINLGNASMRAEYRSARLTLTGKTYRPQALVYYAAPIIGSAHAAKAAAFVRWFASGEGAAILNAFDYEPPSGANRL